MTGRARGVVHRLAAGCEIVARQRSEALATWVRAGRRDDLDGGRAALGPVVRVLLLGIAAYVTLSVLRAVPWLLWLITAAWLRAAWRATRAPADDVDEPLDNMPAGPDVTAVLALLAEVFGDADRVHLSTVLAHLQEQGQVAGWKVADLRARLESLGVPVQPKVKVRGVPTRGIVRADLDDHFPGWEACASPTEVDAA
ncbi:hypothetical protein [Streptomyces sp. NPDC101115]|uniref:hypothetical protein n=1 Tax=Streptomyces sp. NPDC101115 TaxID=3366106 RepID=UPI003818DD8A